uniref:Cytochrome P450 n=1 Tax=Musca domestica TaxID=7370 RepID=T1PB36_MUSDO
MQGSEWLQHRKLIDPAFKPSKLVGFLSIFNKKVKRIFEDMDKCHQMKNSYDILVYCREYTIDVTGETVLGKDFNETTEVNVKHYAQLITRNLKYISDISFKVFYHNNFILNLANLTIFKGARITSEFLASLIDKNIDYYSDGNQPTSQNVKTKDNLVIATVLEALKNDTIGRHLAISSMVHVFSAAFETNSSTMYFVMLMLAMHPEYQERAYAEVCEVFPENDDGEFELTYEHITQLSYLDMFIKETMRLFPTIPHFGRLVVGGDLRLSSGAVLPEGLELIINVYNVHHNKDVWGPHANIFNPDNFLPANMENRHPYAFIPFSKGIRFCLGMRYAEIVLRVTMAKIIMRYKFSTTAKLEDLVIHNHISIQLKEHPPLTIERRANSNKI